MRRLLEPRMLTNVFRNMSIALRTLVTVVGVGGSVLGCTNTPRMAIPAGTFKHVMFFLRLNGVGSLSERRRRTFNARMRLGAVAWVIEKRCITLFGLPMHVVCVVGVIEGIFTK
jgi:hypothetical protein